METRSEKATATLSGTVNKIIQSSSPNAPDKAQINVTGSDPLYRELRVVNTLTDKDGADVNLKPGQTVEVTVEADTKDTTNEKQ